MRAAGDLFPRSGFVTQTAIRVVVHIFQSLVDRLGRVNFAVCILLALLKEFPAEEGVDPSLDDFFRIIDQQALFLISNFVELPIA